MGGGEAMWRVRNDLIVARVHDEGWDIELLEVLAEVGLRERLDALVGVLQAGLHAQGPEVIEDALRDLGTFAVGAEERHGKIPPELRTVLREPGPQVVENVDRKAFGIAPSLEHEIGRAHV